MKKIIFFLLAIIVSIFFTHIILESNIMRIGQKEAAKLRDELHNLNINSIDDNEFYYKTLYYITASGEGFSAEVYKDSKGKLTIGYGFNMDRGDASRNEWDDVFKNYNLSFDEAKKGNLAITTDQALMLKKHGIQKRERELEKIYAPYWHQMRLNERAILTDMYYQLPALVGQKTKIAKFMKEYYKTNKIIYFDMAVVEIKEHSSFSKNPADKAGLQNRNNIRAIIFDSRDCPLYSMPHDELIPVSKQIKVTLGETIIPREVSDNFPKSNNHGDYYIWRTRMDDKVRSTHKEFEGKVFRHEDDMNHPTEEYGCRCYKQKLPIHAVIIDEEEDDDNQTIDDIVKQYEFQRFPEEILIPIR